MDTWRGGGGGGIYTTKNDVRVGDVSLTWLYTSGNSLPGLAIVVKS